MVVKKLSIKEVKSRVGEEVETAGFVHEYRNVGKIKFILLRDWTGFIQITAKKNNVPFFDEIDVNKEDVIYVKGKVVENKIAPDGVELIPTSFKILSKVKKKLPVDPTGVVKSELDTRLNYRYLDLRREEVKDIFIVKSALSNAFRKEVLKRRFVEIHPTAIVAAATEGGADVFPIQYFESKAFLAQSPQLYKQMAVVGGLEKVFMQMHVFRAEKHNTTTHLNEVVQMDIEAGFIDDRKAMDYLEEIFLGILKDVSSMDELAKLNESFSVPKEVKRYTYTDIVNLLNENNVKMEWGEDFTKEQEKKMYEIIGEEAFIIYEWPTKTRAFYSMPKEGEEEVCLAYDLMYKGLEIASGAQRIHIPELLEEQLRKRGLNPADFEFYIEAFRYGAPPHAGWSIGLERLTMKVLDLPNIREAMLFPRDRHRLFP